MGEEPDRDRAQDRIGERKAERAAATEAIMADVTRRLDDLEYPVTSEELATEYGDDPIELPNETESLGSVFDRLVGEEFASSAEAREAIYGELTGEAGTANEANAERDLDQLDDRARQNSDEPDTNAL